MTDIIHELSDEADLCRNEGADDIAALLDRSAAAIRLNRMDIDRLRARVAELEKDAARYQWCIDNIGWREWHDELGVFMKGKAEISAAIDAAMAKEQLHD